MSARTHKTRPGEERADREVVSKHSIAKAHAIVVSHFLLKLHWGLTSPSWQDFNNHFYYL